MHPRLVDTVFTVGHAESTQSYLRQDKIIEIALRSGCNAIHPGYGFLSENPDFAQRVEENGLIFIGPSSSSIRAMGDKTAARELMKSHNVPIIPGTESAVTSEEEAKIIVEQIGYPILIKAAGGGGGKGMRIVYDQKDLPSSMESARNEARNAFSDDRIYIEKYLESPRHIEFQILADHHGNVVYLGERECSIQRRHQKVVEESPSAIVNDDLRARMGESAVEAARACGYVNAGTIEFLVDKNLHYYFLEMNTRLQVEHPVTEMVTGIDLVKMQIRIASGEPMPLNQEQIQRRGHAIECRLCAEDVFSNFLPSTGKIEYYKPSQGFGVREDSGIEEGSEIQRYYDPLFAKLITWGENRNEAIERMKRALSDYRIIGIDTTIPFCLFVMNHPKFIEGDFNTHFVPTYFNSIKATEEHENNLHVAALASVFYCESRRAKSTNLISQNGATDTVSIWRRIGRQSQLR